MIPQHWITGNATRGTYQQKEIFLQSRKHAKRQVNTHEERVDWALALTLTACRRSFVLEGLERLAALLVYWQLCHA